MSANIDIGVSDQNSEEQELYVAGALPCVKCGYELDGCNTRAKCPECGSFVKDSLNQTHLADRLSLRLLSNRVFSIGRLFATELALQVGVVIAAFNVDNKWILFGLVVPGMVGIGIAVAVRALRESACQLKAMPGFSAHGARVAIISATIQGIALVGTMLVAFADVPHSIDDLWAGALMFGITTFAMSAFARNASMAVLLSKMAAHLGHKSQVSARVAVVTISILCAIAFPVLVIPLIRNGTSPLSPFISVGVVLWIPTSSFLVAAMSFGLSMSIGRASARPQTVLISKDAPTSTTGTSEQPESSGTGVSPVRRTQEH